MSICTGFVLPFFGCILLICILVGYLKLLRRKRTKLVVCFGDSLTAGWYKDGAASEPYARHVHLPETKVVDFGEPGFTSEALVKRADDVLVCFVVSNSVCHSLVSDRRPCLLRTMNFGRSFLWVEQTTSVGIPCLHWKLFPT